MKEIICKNSLKVLFDGLITHENSIYFMESNYVAFNNESYIEKSSLIDKNLIIDHMDYINNAINYIVNIVFLWLWDQNEDLVIKLHHLIP